MNTSISARLKGIGRHIFRQNEAVVFTVLLILFVLLASASPYFLTADNIKTLMIGLSAEGIIVIGMTLALAAGGFDLSVGSVMGLSAIVSAQAFVSGVPIWVAVILGLAAGAAVGVINGWLISKVKVNPFITTLGMMTATRGLVNVITDGSSISVTGVPDFFRYLGTGSLFGLPVIVLIFLVLAIIADLVMRNSSAVRKAYYVGSNSQAAALSGINVNKVLFFVYLTVGVLAAIAGILSLARFGTATPAMGSGTEMRVISAAIIGGASIAGGAGTVLGSVLGLILLSLINNGLVLMNVSVNWQGTISGVILIVAVAIDILSKRRANSGSSRKKKSTPRDEVIPQTTTEDN